MKYEFAGVGFNDLKDMPDFWQELNEELFVSKTTYHHEEPELDFDYVYLLRVLDMYEITGDDEFEDEPWDVELELSLTPSSLYPAIREEIENYSDGYCEYSDIVLMGYTVSMGGTACTDEDLDHTINMAANVVDTVNGLRGFYLDRYWNRVGSTGWNIIEYCLGKRASVFGDWYDKLRFGEVVS